MMRKGLGSGQGETKRLLAEEVFTHIASRIIDGTLAPGQRIRDVEVADELHVSRTPVREALQRLERLGMVTMYPSRYTEVTAVTPAVIAQTLEFAGYQAGVTTRMGLARFGDAERARLAELAEQMLTAQEGPEISRTRWAVFSYLSEHCDNTQQRALIQDAGVSLFRNLRDWVIPEDDRERMHQIYRDFRDAVLDGDGDRAEQLARAMHYV
ncbi:GntR family transcriptional regulator [Microbacterium hydrocarbonoxydans]|uniref:GntR family transcriptional regulator n=1 Tax=Microbacterium hydrocarbonoxydans TaxID=273678 RepID=UPI003D980609